MFECELHTSKQNDCLDCWKETYYTLRELTDNEIANLKNKLHRRNMQIAELKKKAEFNVGHLSINDLIQKAIKFLRNQGYKVNR